MMEKVPPGHNENRVPISRTTVEEFGERLQLRTSQKSTEIQLKIPRNSVYWLSNISFCFSFCNPVLFSNSEVLKISRVTKQLENVKL